MFRRLTEQDFYEVLEVGYTASPEEIQTAYESGRYLDAKAKAQVVKDKASPLESSVRYPYRLACLPKRRVDGFDWFAAKQKHMRLVQCSWDRSFV